MPYVSEPFGLRKTVHCDRCGRDLDTWSFAALCRTCGEIDPTTLRSCDFGEWYQRSRFPKRSSCSICRAGLLATEAMTLCSLCAMQHSDQSHRGSSFGRAGRVRWNYDYHLCTDCGVVQVYFYDQKGTLQFRYLVPGRVALQVPPVPCTGDRDLRKQRCSESAHEWMVLHEQLGDANPSPKKIYDTMSNPVLRIMGFDERDALTCIYGWLNLWCSWCGSTAQIMPQERGDRIILKTTLVDLLANDIK